MNKVWKMLVVCLTAAVVVLGVAVVRLSGGQQPTPPADTADTAAASQTPAPPEGEQGREEEQIVGLRCSISLGAMEIVTGETLSASDRSGSDFEARIEDGVYIVEGSTTADNAITVTVPQDLILETVELTVRGGALTAEDVNTKALYTDCDGGALTFSGQLTGDGEVSQKWGETTLHLSGAESDYNYDLSYDRGHIGLGQQQFAGLQGSEHIDNGAAHTLDVECSMGDVGLIFP